MRLLALMLLTALTARGAVSIGNEAAVTTPASAHYSTTMNVRPGNGEAVSNNPPIFTWFYNTNQIADANPNGFANHYSTSTNAFQFQVATNPTFTGNLAVDVNTPFNCYNFLAPLDTNGTRQFWWRVKHVTNGVAWWTNGVYTFTISVTASNLDRSMLADSNYHATNGAHPVFCFRSNEQAAVWSYITDPAQSRSYADLLAAANAATNAAWWTDTSEWAVNATPHPKYAVVVTDGYARANNISAVLLLWKLSGDNRWTNASMTGWLVTNAAHLNNWFVSPSNNYPMQDYGDSESAIPIRAIVGTYDWMFDYLGSNTGTFNGRLRTNLLHTVRLTARFWIGNDLWAAAPAPTGTYINHYDYNYRDRTNYCVPSGAPAKQDNSHGSMSRNAVLPIAVLGADDPEIGLFRDWQLNYTIARTSGFAGWAAHHIGVFGYVDNNIYNRTLQSSLMVLRITYPQARLDRTEFCTRFPEWYSRMIPYGKRMYHGAFGDGAPSGNAGYFFAGLNRGYDLALLTGSGYARQLYDLNREYSNSVWEATSHFDQLPTRYHFPLPAPATNTTSALYAEDGFVAASSKSPSEFDCYTNGVGFEFKAATRGNNQNHVTPDGYFNLWAYGSQLTDGGGAGLDQYGYNAASTPGLFVNGYGVRADYAAPQLLPLMSSIVAFTNYGTNFVYFCADLTPAFTNAAHAQSNNVLKVRLHALFVSSKYWVFYYEFATRTPSTFAFRWHIPWVVRYAAGGSALANETAFSGSRFGSNGYTRGTNGFTYTGGRYDDANSQGPAIPRVPVHVMFGNATNQFGIYEATGTDFLYLTGPGAFANEETNSTLNPFLDGGRIYATPNPDRAVGLWATNRTSATNWNLLTVVVAVKPGEDDPESTRIDDNTVSVTYENTTKIITFDAGYTNSFDFQVNVSQPAQGGSEPSPGVSTPGQGRVISGGRVMRGDLKLP